MLYLYLYFTKHYLLFNEEMLHGYHGLYIQRYDYILLSSLLYLLNLSDECF